MAVRLNQCRRIEQRSAALARSPRAHSNPTWADPITYRSAGSAVVRRVDLLDSPFLDEAVFVHFL
jgi:hypothetical protein